MSTDCAWADPGLEELKPCPFCGGEAEIIVVASYYKVRCSRCSGSATIATDRAAAIGFWNRRDGAEKKIVANIHLDSEEVKDLVMAQIKEDYHVQLKCGEWVDSNGNPTREMYSAYCSACGEWSEYLTDYCGHCGAYMRGEE